MMCVGMTDGYQNRKSNKAVTLPEGGSRNARWVLICGWHVPLAADQRRVEEERRSVSISFSANNHSGFSGPRTNDVHRGSEANNADGFIHLRAITPRGSAGYHIPLSWIFNGNTATRGGGAHCSL